MKKGYALVTGGNRGIGFYLAKELAKDGYPLILVGRNVEKLEEARRSLSKYTEDIVIMAFDLCDPDAPERLYHHIQAKHMEVEVLVNNAGFGSYGVFHKTELKNQLDMITVNISALTHLTHLFVQHMVERRRGKILNVASVAGFQAGPYMNVYFASKAFVISFTEALAHELKPFGINVTALCPGSTDTNFFQTAKVTRKVDTFKIRVSPEYVAKKGYKALKRGKVLEIPGLNNKIMIQIQRFVPRKLIMAILDGSMKNA